MERLKDLYLDDEARIVFQADVSSILADNNLTYKQSVALTDLTRLMIKKNNKDLAKINLNLEGTEDSHLDFEEKNNQLIDEEFAVEKKMKDPFYEKSIGSAIKVFNEVFKKTPEPINLPSSADITNPKLVNKYKHLLRMIGAANAIIIAIARERTLN